MSEHTALVLGATGLVGGHCLQLLLQDSQYSTVHAVVRKPLTDSHPKLQQHAIDFAGLGALVTQLDPSVVFCCLGTTISKAGSNEAFRRVDYEYPLAAAQAAAQAGCSQFLLVTAIGASTESSVFYNRVKGEVERDISALPLPSVHIARPSMLLGERSERRIGESIGKALMLATSPLMLGGARKYRPIAGLTVAKALTSLARTAEKGRHIYESDALERLGSALR